MDGPPEGANAAKIQYTPATPSTIGSWLMVPSHGCWRNGGGRVGVVGGVGG